MVSIEEIRCKACGMCAAFCPKDCFYISSRINAKGFKVAATKNQDECISCGICYTVCPDVAITVFKE